MTMQPSRGLRLWAALFLFVAGGEGSAAARQGARDLGPAGTEPRPLEAQTYYQLKRRTVEEGKQGALKRERRRLTPRFAHTPYRKPEWEQHLVLDRSGGAEGYRVAKVIPTENLTEEQQEVLRLVNLARRKGSKADQQAADGIRFRELPYRLDQRFEGTDVRAAITAAKALEKQGVRLTPAAIQTENSSAWLYLVTLSRAFSRVAFSYAKDPEKQLRGGRLHEYAAATRADERALAPYAKKIASAFTPRQSVELLYALVDKTYDPSSYWEPLTGDVTAVVSTLFNVNQLAERQALILGHVRGRLRTAIRTMDAALLRQAAQPQAEGIAAEVTQAQTALLRTLWVARNTARVADEVLSNRGGNGDGKYFEEASDAFYQLTERLPGSVQARRERLDRRQAGPGAAAGDQVATPTGAQTLAAEYAQLLARIAPRPAGD